jgi:hypothetical protein
MKLRTFVLAICGLLFLSGLSSMPKVLAQTTSISKVTYPPSALYDLQAQTTSPPLILNATVNYAGAKPGDYLEAGVFDLDDGNLVSGLGSSSPQSCATTVPFAACLIPLGRSEGFENLQFLLTHPNGVWNLALVVALLDNVHNLIPSSYSDYTFTVNVKVALTLQVDAPSVVAIRIDGVNGSGGSISLKLAPGNHTISVPEIVQVGNGTRIRFVNWSDGSTEANRSVALNHDVVLQANYVTQYRLELVSPAVSLPGAGWYDNGSVVRLVVPTTSPPMKGPLGMLGGTWVFQGWSIDGVSVADSRTKVIVMISPHTVEANWKAVYDTPLVTFAGILGVLALTLYLIRVKRHSRTRKVRGTGRKRPRRFMR